MGHDRDVKWYVEIYGKNYSHANEVIARMLPAENTRPGQITSDGKKRDLWLCDSFKTFARLMNNQAAERISLRGFVQEDDGQIRPHRYLLKKSPGRALKAMAKKIGQTTQE